ncbi:LOW QUALITY PROTEIN: cadherin-like protein 26 [Lates calcarifer]|uniref:LOW QUALITY PROTEIN: cadherin-like protein 26 n=1 Tax=Lates calcarifer TaxID=8187 RepID=A0AAJ8BCJ0_LATCA|nr:LOW QUALITY PROTEIN: cadherin-like protein 26 [Lates calcarifer]
MLYFFLLVSYLSSTTCSEVLSRHRRTWIIDSFTIEEGHPGPFPYVLGKISVDRNHLVYFDLYGEGVDEDPKGVISIHKESGTLSVHKPVDYEEKTIFMLKFEARKTDLSIDTKLGVEISIRDINDNPPRFQRDLYEISVDEKNTQGSHLLTVVAYDIDQRGTPNSTFHYEIKSVSPNPPDTEFFIDESGTISFKGCLDHEVANMFTILVEAKDHGEVISLSSSTTVVIHVRDGNNHIPTITGQTGTGKVIEDETGSSPLRLHVTDKDTPNSPAWRARYTIKGDDGEHFKIETDPDTNDGILTVVKPLDFEEGARRELSISVENEAPYFSCKVKERTSSGLWTVDTSEGDGPGAGQPHSVNVIITVEDANDPPVFSVAVKEAVLEENAPVGTWIEKVTAVDPDSTHARDFVYKVGSDPAGWVTVDPQTGDITTVKTPDRESPHVINGIYTVLLHAEDDGKPAKTGTATLQIHVIDQNDNVPQPTSHNLDVCVSDSPTTTNITAFDIDSNPFGGPFTFELLGDVKGKWKLNPLHGYTAGLVKEPGVYTGQHTIDLKISDMQGKFGVHNLSVTVCDCSVRANCRTRIASNAKATSGAIGVVFAALILLLVLLLMAVVCTCKKEFATLEADSSGETLLVSNTENPGTDCKVPDGVMAVSADIKHHDPSKWQSLHDGMQHTHFSAKDIEQNFMDEYFTKRDYRRENLPYLLDDEWNQTTWNSFTAKDYHHAHQFEDMSTMECINKGNLSYVSDVTLLTLLHRKLSSLQETEDNLLDYEPQLYADEGDSNILIELENITIPDDDSLQKALTDLGPKFNQLASICRPQHIQN